MNKLPLFAETGEFVLVGRRGVSTPGDRFVARVLLDCGDELAIEHAPPSGGYLQRQFVPSDCVIKRGSLQVCGEARRQACEIARALSCAVSEAETALGKAREAVWQKLAEAKL